MRTQKDMRKTLELIFQSWNMFSDIRLGQLLTNAASFKNQDIFYIEDHELEAAIKEFTDQTIQFKKEQ